MRHGLGTEMRAVLALLSGVIKTAVDGLKQMMHDFESFSPTVRRCQMLTRVAAMMTFLCRWKREQSRSRCRECKVFESQAARACHYATKIPRN